MTMTYINILMFILHLWYYFFPLSGASSRDNILTVWMSPLLFSQCLPCFPWPDVKWPVKNLMLMTCRHIMALVVVVMTTNAAVMRGIVFQSEYATRCGGPVSKTTFDSHAAAINKTHRHHDAIHHWHFLTFQKTYQVWPLFQKQIPMLERRKPEGIYEKRSLYQFKQNTAMKKWMKTVCFC